MMSAGASLWQALEAERPLQVVGAINAYSALLAERAGFKALYLSGAGVANASFGLPDLAMTTLNDVCEDIRRICYATDLPLLVDADTGWGGAFMIGRTIREMTRAGAAGCHIEDQVAEKRCGHRPGKALVETAEMADRIKAAVDGKTDTKFVVMARTDAHAVEGQQAALDRASAYVEAGADMIFAEALTTIDEYREFASSIDVPVLANLTEFGKTPLFTTSDMADAGVRLRRGHNSMTYSAITSTKTNWTSFLQKAAQAKSRTGNNAGDINGRQQKDRRARRRIGRENGPVYGRQGRRGPYVSWLRYLRPG
jgi:methylisocitrate lyase